MSPMSDVIVVNTAELRSGAAALRRAAADTGEVRQRLPGEVWGAPDWLASGAADELGVLRGSLDELHGELMSEANRLEARAAEVDGAERRWANVVNGELRCGCVLPSGEVVATPLGGTAASAASGPGVTDGMVVGVAGLAAAGVQIVAGPALAGPTIVYSGQPAPSVMDGVVITQPIAPTNPAITYTTIGGQGILGGFQVVTAAPAATAPVTYIGGLGNVSGIQITPPADVPGYRSGIDTGIIAGAGVSISYNPATTLNTPYDAQIQAGADRMASGIANLVGAGSAGSGGRVTGTGVVPFIPSGPVVMPGDGQRIYTGYDGKPFSAYPTDSRVTSTMDPNP